MRVARAGGRAFAKTFAVGGLGECRDATKSEVFDPSARLGNGGKQCIATPGTHGGLGNGSCTMPFTAMKVGAVHGSVSVVVAGSRACSSLAGSASGTLAPQLQSASENSPEASPAFILFPSARCRNRLGAAATLSVGSSRLPVLRISTMVEKDRTGLALTDGAGGFLRAGRWDGWAWETGPNLKAPAL
jgi:hypothetical protein